jgi:hypothetical protein
MSKLALFAACTLVASLLMSGMQTRAVETAGAAAFIRGDANNDGLITLADAIHVAAYLFAHGPQPLPSEDSGDANCDTRVDPRDVVYLINYTLRGGPKPKCPS